MKLVSNFNPVDLQVLLTKSNGEVVASYTSDFKGRDYFHIRTLYKDDKDNWGPGKGFSVPADQANELCTAISKLVKENA